MFLEPLPLKPSGRAVLLENEIERIITRNVNLRFYEELGGLETSPAEKYENGSLVLTSHRLLWIDAKTAPNAGTSCWIPIEAIHHWHVSKSVAAKLNLKSESIKFNISLTYEKKPAIGGLGGITISMLKVSFKDGIPSNFAEQLTKTQQEALWNARKQEKAEKNDAFDIPEEISRVHLLQMTNMGFDRKLAIQALKATNDVSEAIDRAIAFRAEIPPEPSQPKDEPNVIRYGIGDIFKREEEKQKRTQQALGEAFQDLKSLMSKAEEMVKLADQFYSNLSREAVSINEATEIERDTIEELVSMGITSPVTKQSAGSLYHDQLCRQLADFLEGLLPRRGGIMTLTDVYCLYNRARGAAELVSPDDLIQSAKLFEKLHLPLRLRSFPSGVRVIQSSDHDETFVGQKIEEMVQTERPDQLSRALTSLEVASELRVPLTIASEHLLLAERQGILCRDDGPHGLRFYKNFFNEM